jgi:hypothetical protein
VDEILLYGKYALAIVVGSLAIGITIKLLQKIAALMILGVWFAAIAGLCYGINNGGLSGWGEIIATSIGAGLLAGLACVPLIPISTMSLEAANRKTRLETSGDGIGNA